MAERAPFAGSDAWLPPEPLILASTSPTRRLLLENAGLRIACRAPDVDERLLEAGFVGHRPGEVALRLAEAKASSVARRCPGQVVVGADQVLALDGEILHKPADPAEAASQLARLSGRTHILHSAVALASDGVVVDRFVETACLTLRALDAGAIATYVALAGPERVTASVGGYQLEGLGIHLFHRIEGDHTTILGLPLLPLLDRLRARGWLRF
ncbi:MAG TPA: Maf family nucleotide pyrophosphatase [Methylobacterium sp.]|jgi:septum formation protein